MVGWAIGWPTCCAHYRTIHCADVSVVKTSTHEVRTWKTQVLTESGKIGPTGRKPEGPNTPDDARFDSIGGFLSWPRNPQPEKQNDLS